MAAGHVQLAPDGTGKDIDADALTSSEAGTPTVYRQVVVVGDPTTYGNKQAVSGAGSAQTEPRDDASGNPVSITAKGTQGTNGVATQDLKDSGRTYVALTVTAMAGVTAEALATFSQNKGGTVTAGVSSYAVPAGKTLRIQSILLSVTNSSATMIRSRCLLRHNTAGAVTATSPLVAILEASTSAATANASGQTIVNFPDGLEIAGGTQIGLSHVDTATTAVISIHIIGYEY